MTRGASLGAPRCFRSDGSSRLRSVGRDQVRVLRYEQVVELLRREDVALLLGAISHVEPERRRFQALIWCAVVASVVECAVAELEERLEELLDALPVHRR